jgi:hemoglobin
VTLLDKYGLVKTARVVQGFYEDMLSDPTLGRFFERVNITELAEHQTIFLAMVMGGSAAYTPNDVMRAHSHRGISPDDFEKMIGYLKSRLESNGFEPDGVQEIVATYRDYQHLVTEVND